MKTILSLDGGGVRGVATARFLYLLEQYNEKSLFDTFDLFAGTSIGGIIALGIAIRKLKGVDIIELFSHSNANLMMPKSVWDKTFGIVQTCAKYDGIGKRRIIDSVFEGSRLIDALKPVLVTAYDIERRVSCVLKSNDMGGKSCVLAAEAADATSAAPVYFPPVKVLDSHWLIDGGVVSNNPAMCAYSEASKLWPGEEIRILSVGTGRLTKSINGEEACGFGVLGWVTNDLLGIAMDTSMVDYQCKTLLGSNYVRIDSELAGADDDMDNCSEDNIKALQHMGDYWWDAYAPHVLAWLERKEKT